MLWFCYILGLALFIFAKVWNHKIQKNVSWKRVWMEFFINTEGDGTTVYYTGTIIAAELMLGAWYMGEFPGIAQQQVIPLHWTAAFFLGSIAELVAPYFIKKAVDMISGAAAGLFNKSGKQ